MCLDAAISISSGDRPPPIFLCVDCVDMLRRDHVPFLWDVLNPLQVVSLKCENKVKSYFFIVQLIFWHVGGCTILLGVLKLIKLAKLKYENISLLFFCVDMLRMYHVPFFSVLKSLQVMSL